MANLNRWEGGTPRLEESQCGGCRENSFPGPHRMAAHRRRAPYNLGNCFDPACDEACEAGFAQLAADDIVWLALVPDDSLLTGARVRVEVADAVNPIGFDVVAERVNLEDGVAGAAVVVPAGLTGLSTATLNAAWGAIGPDYTDPYVGNNGEGIRVGLQLTSIPAGGVLDFKGRICLSVQASDFETVSQANCRGNRCVIDNP